MIGREHDSNFRSSICWPEIKDEEAPSGEFKQLGIAFADAMEAIAETHEVSRATDSPIETFFGSRFYRHAKKLCERHGLKFAFGLGSDDYAIRLRPQYPLLRFRYDFAMELKGREKPILLVECDGKAFHSTPQQRENDYRKNEAAREAGIALIRFTGSELYRDADGCVRRAMQAAGMALPV